MKEALGLALANLQLGDPDPALRLSAVRLLGESGDPLARTRLENLLDPAVEPEEGVRIAAATSLAQVKRRLLVGDLLARPSAACRWARSCCSRRSAWRSPTACSG